MKYFIADTHLGHEKMIRGMLRCYPGSRKLFRSIEEHDEFLIGSINCTVRPNDQLFILGDFAALPGKYRMQIKCKHVFLIRGNHDPVQKSLNVFGEMPYMRVVKLRSGNASLKVVLSHFPQAYWEGSHRGWGHLYGHTHGQREDTLDQAFGYKRRALDVGVDNLRKEYGDYSPLGEDQVLHRFLGVPGHDDPEYYNAYQRVRDLKYGFDPQTNPIHDHETI